MINMILGAACAGMMFLAMPFLFRAFCAWADYWDERWSK